MEKSGKPGERERACLLEEVKGTLCGWIVEFLKRSNSVC